MITLLQFTSYIAIGIKSSKDHQQVKSQNIWQPYKKSDIIWQSSFNRQHPRSYLNLSLYVFNQTFNYFNFIALARRKGQYGQVLLLAFWHFGIQLLESALNIFIFYYNLAPQSKIQKRIGLLLLLKLWPMYFTLFTVLCTYFLFTISIPFQFS